LEANGQERTSVPKDKVFVTKVTGACLGSAAILEEKRKEKLSSAYGN
jgi:hypothetical protein